MNLSSSRPRRWPIRKATLVRRATSHSMAAIQSCSITVATRSQITAGHVDVFAVRVVEGSTEGARHHLFRAETGEIILDLQDGFNRSASHIQVLAVGSPGTEAQLCAAHGRSISSRPVTTWIRRLARLIAGPNPSWDMLEVASEGAAAIPPGERRRGPARSIVWVSLEAGTARPMGLDPIDRRGRPAAAADVGHVDRGRSVRLQRASAARTMPDADELWRAVDQFHLGVAGCVREYLARDVEPGGAASGSPHRADRGADRGILRSPFRRRRAARHPHRDDDRLGRSLVQRLPDRRRSDQDAIRRPSPVGAGPRRVSRRFTGAIEIARAARLRVRRTLLRGEWWTEDGGPLVAWHGEARNPVALIRRGNRRYVMLDTRTGTQRPVDRSARDGAGPGSGIVLSGASGAPASVPGPADLLDSGTPPAASFVS